MGDFVHKMAKEGWIEGTVGPRKRPGAYCTGFLKSRTPRVYMTYTGRPNDVIVLAHELGHAFHSWVMRDLPLSQRGYGMAIAETASTFGESVVRDALLERAKTPAARLEIVWEEAAALVGFVLNIPVRFEFERNFYEARAERPLRAAELKELMSTAWRNWYGDCLAEPDPLFWANKLHFYISGLSFYNFPYLFGYLFSLGVYARRKTLGEEFFARYEALLLDTGRMTAEELAAKHLDVDLTQPDFWRERSLCLQRASMYSSSLSRVNCEGRDQSRPLAGARSGGAERAGMSALRAGALVAACALALGIGAAEHAPDGADAADDMSPDLPGAADYLSQDLRAEVEALKAEVRRTPSNRANARARAHTLWAWVNAYARSGRYVPVNATFAAAGVLASPNQPRLAALDPTIRELALLDEQPNAVGALVADVGPFEARSYVTFGKLIRLAPRMSNQAAAS